MNDPSFPSGWFPDPLGRHEYRFFNGRSWTSDVSDGGQRYVDPLGVDPGAPGGPGALGPTNSAATAAVVMGSIALVIAWVPFVVVAGLVLAVLAVVFGGRGLRRSRAHGVGRGASVGGIVLGSLGIAASVVGIVLTVVVTREVIRFVEPGPVLTEVSSCTVEGRDARVDGTLTNTDDRVRSYTLFVEVEGDTQALVIDDVQPGATIPWSTVVATRTSMPDCEPELIVNGPFPFDLEVDPVR
ncbi:MAG: DUF2510 domain-containing protein [Ilumatobacter sp.]|nr:DUF2510 domain-containing protein [Ilumatobacter sp.]